MKNQIIIHSSGNQDRIALIEDGELAQLFIETEENQRTVGNIYVAQVHKVMSGIRAAFIDMGTPKDAFLHFSDAGDHLDEYISMLNGPNAIPPQARKDVSNKENLSNYDKQLLAGKVLKTGQKLLGQIVKEPIGSKGPRVSTDITIAGRFLVLIPMGDYIAISKKISNYKERRRLKGVLSKMVPDGFGVIVRTVAQDQDNNAIEDDLRDVLLKWENIYYESPTDEVVPKKTVVRLGLIQWQMRPYNGLDELMQQAEYFVDTVSRYRSDFALFPEFFNAPLMAKNNHLSESDAIRSLASYTEEIKNRFSELSISYNINIITGSMPEIVEGKLYNVGYLCRRDGTIERYEKIHVTPDEAKVWGMQGGHSFQTFDTDCGKIGVLICYDSEFPELSRLMADEGMDILFVPFLTDTQNGFSRVRYCAQARAIENECYVAIAGSVGNLPNVHNMDIQYA